MYEKYAAKQREIVVKLLEEELNYTDFNSGRELKINMGAKKPQTNADRIRAELENDEELAALYVRYNPDTHMYHTDAGAFTDFVAAMDAELEYLQQPAEGE